MYFLLVFYNYDFFPVTLFPVTFFRDVFPVTFFPVTFFPSTGKNIIGTDTTKTYRKPSV